MSRLLLIPRLAHFLRTKLYALGFSSLVVATARAQGVDEAKGFWGVELERMREVRSSTTRVVRFSVGRMPGRRKGSRICDEATGGP